jgi:hypothetical protein
MVAENYLCNWSDSCMVFYDMLRMWNSCWNIFSILIINKNQMATKKKVVKKATKKVVKKAVKKVAKKK